MKKLLASDYDGTISQKGVITPETIKSINMFRQMGNLFGIVTGRDYVNGCEIFRNGESFPYDFIIANNGAVAYDAKGNIYFAEKVRGRRIFGKNTIAQDLIAQILQLTSKPCGIALEKERYVFHREYPSGAKVDNMQYSAISVLENVNNFISANAECDTEAQAQEVTRTLMKNFGDYVNPVQNGICIDITACGVDKSSGIARLADCIGIEYGNIWTAGDNFNDISMNEKFHGCAMSDGVEELKKVSEYICKGVAEVIEVILKE